MARPRAFEYDDLKHLLYDHPKWSDQQLADALTEIARKDDPTAPAVNVNTMASVMRRYRHTWERQTGQAIPTRLVQLDEYLPPADTVPLEHRNDRELRYLREVAKHERGDHPRDEVKVHLRRVALDWRDGIVAGGMIVDLSTRGVPFTRTALASERNEDGTSKAVAAWLLPGWRS